MPSSEPLASSATVIEGMPGAGKTTLLGQLAHHGHTVLGEYTTPGGEVLTHQRHPHHHDEAGHLTNWLHKAAQLEKLTGPVWVDRDWLTALAFATSTGTLHQRATWAYDHLTAGRLALPWRWIILDLSPALSLQRRSGRLQAGHPWADPAVLQRLQDFYRNPAARLGTAHPRLAALVTTVPLRIVDALAEPDELAQAVEPAATW